MALINEWLATDRKDSIDEIVNIIRIYIMDGKSMNLD